MPMGWRRSWLIICMCVCVCVCACVNVHVWVCVQACACTLCPHKERKHNYGNSYICTRPKFRKHTYKSTCMLMHELVSLPWVQPSHLTSYQAYMWKHRERPGHTWKVFLYVLSQHTCKCYNTYQMHIHTAGSWWWWLSGMYLPSSNQRQVLGLSAVNDRGLYTQNQNCWFSTYGKRYQLLPYPLPPGYQQPTTSMLLWLLGVPLLIFPAWSTQ